MRNREIKLNATISTCHNGTNITIGVRVPWVSAVAAFAGSGMRLRTHLAGKWWKYYTVRIAFPYSRPVGTNHQNSDRQTIST